MTRGSIAVGLAVTLLSAQPTVNPGADSDQSAACMETFRQSKVPYFAGLEEGPEVRARLREDAERMARRYGFSATDCADRFWLRTTVLFRLDGNYEAAVRRTKRLLARASPPVSRERRVEYLRYMAYNLERMGEMSEGARTYYQAAAESRGTPAPMAGYALLDAASTARENGDLGAASGFIDEALEMLQDSVPSNPELGPLLGKALQSRIFLRLAQIDTQDRDLTRAEATEIADLATKARAWLGATDEGVSPAYWATVTAIRARALARLGDFAHARHDIRQALPVARSAYAFHPEGESNVYINESYVEAYAGNLTAAFDAALRSRAQARDAHMQKDVAIAAERAAELAALMGDDATAEHYLAETVELWEIERDRLRFQEWSLTLARYTDRPRQRLAELWLGQGRAREAFDLIERGRARYLEDLTWSARLRETLSQDLRAALTRATEGQAEARRELLLGAADDAQRAGILARLSAYQDSVRQITASEPPPAAVPLEAIRDSLGASGQTALSYVMGRETTWAFVVSADTFAAVPLPLGRERLAATLRQAGGPWRTDGLVQPSIRRESLLALSQMLLARVGVWIPREGSVVIVPAPEIADLPFAILPDPSDPGTYLVHRTAISQQPSLSLYVQGGLYVQGERAATFSLPPVSLVSPGVSEGAVSRGTLPPLPGARAEARVVASKLGGSVWSTDQHGKADLMAALRESPVVHIATHAVVDPVYPMRSRLVLGDEPEEDLWLYEASAQDVRCRLVILNACSTADGQPLGSEGLLSLDYVMRGAGAHATLANLWPVVDQAGAAILSTFAARLADGMRADEALRQAQLAYLDAHGGAEANPYWWGGYVLSGYAGPVLPGNRGMGVRTVAIVVGLLTAAWLFRRTRHERDRARPV